MQIEMSPTMGVRITFETEAEQEVLAEIHHLIDSLVGGDLLEHRVSDELSELMGQLLELGLTD